MNIIANMWAGLTALVDSVTEPAYLIIVGPIAVVAALFVWAEIRADKVRTAREELHAQFVAFQTDQAEQRAASASFTAHQRHLDEATRRAGATRAGGAA